MGDTVIAYIAGKEMARGRVTAQGHVTRNQQTYQSVTDFYMDSIHCISSVGDYDDNKQHYNNCYRTARDFHEN